MKYWKLRSYKDFREFADADMFSEERRPGIFNIRLKNWKLLDPLLYTMIEMSRAVFRGVSKDKYELEPSIFRVHAFNHRKTIQEKNAYINRCYDHFIEAIRGRRGPLSKPLEGYDKYELWSLGRHFGVNTTLLDWSHSPYICLFFAFSSWGDDGVRSLFCLKKNIIEDVRGTEPEAQEITLAEKANYDSLLFYRPMSDDNFRMINQQGLFTVSRSPHTIDDWVSANYETISGLLKKRLAQEQDAEKIDRLRTEVDSGWILLKIDIETERQDRKQILKKLNRMNINYATLFPDVEGAALYANMQGGIRHY